MLGYITYLRVLGCYFDVDAMRYTVVFYRAHEFCLEKITITNLRSHRYFSNSSNDYYYVFNLVYKS